MEAAVVGIRRLKYLVEDVDRHGNVRVYVRVPGKPKIRLRGMPGSQEFMDGYHAALKGIDLAKPKRPVLKPPPKGSFGELCQAYYASGEFKLLDSGTQAWRRRYLDVLTKTDGDNEVARIGPQHVRGMRDKLAAKKGAANQRLKALKALFAWAVEVAKKLHHNPAAEVKPLKYATTGHHSWSEEEVAAFEVKHPVGSNARLAMTLLLFTACRREDVTRLGPQMIKAGRLRYVQAKNEDRSPTAVDLPVHPTLAAVIAASPSGHLTFLVSAYGKPFTVAGFGMRFREWCDQAGLPHCSAHGLRKAAATRLAEAGASAHEIMAITGHKSLAEVERYTRAARQKGLADSAMAKLVGGAK